MNQLNATLKKDRIISIDILRGFAILGIIIMNIQSFSMPGSAYMNAFAFGDLNGANYWVWMLSHIFVSEKLMALFSILFGAGIILFNSKGDGQIKTGKLHYRRNFILLLFGAFHAHIIWYGDILFSYAICAFLAFVFRKMKVRTLIIVGAAFFIIPPIFFAFSYISMPYWPPENLEEMSKIWLPSAEILNKEIAAMQGSWMDQNSVRMKSALMLQTQALLMMVFWRVTGLMLLGMALFKSGVLSAMKSTRFYTFLTIIGLGLGFALVLGGVNYNIQHNYEQAHTMFIGSIFNYFGSIGVCLGYIGLIMLIAKSSRLNAFKNALSNVGRMAFTNYILTSIIALFIFTGLGFGLFGLVDRMTQIYITLGIWAVLIVYSNIWLKHYRFGPLEWLWKSLTYWKAQPFKKQSN